jgi:hypothetical protein
MPQMNTTEYIALLQEMVKNHDTFIQQVDELTEILGSAEDIMVDDAAMTLLNTSIENIIAQIKHSQQKLQQAIEASRQQS